LYVVGKRQAILAEIAEITIIPYTWANLKRKEIKMRRVAINNESHE